jgi:hypothetical protein
MSSAHLCLVLGLRRTPLLVFGEKLVIGLNEYNPDWGTSIRINLEDLLLFIFLTDLRGVSVHV